MLNMTVLLVFGLFVVIATAHNITFLEVPRYGDPRVPAHLVCHYVSERGDPPLHSVKWYRGNDEIFRYTPGQQPTTRTFNTSMGEGVTGSCNQHSCSITVKLPQVYNSMTSFMCEVSTEGPRFAVVKQAKNLTVAVILKEDPVISGVPGSVQFGEHVVVNCTAGPAMPPANIIWYIDGKPEKTESWPLNKTHVTPANERGLRASWRALTVRVASPRGYIGLRCEATQPTLPPYTRAANTTILVARSPLLSSFTASGCSTKERDGLMTAIFLAVHIFSKCSALSDIARK